MRPAYWQRLQQRLRSRRAFRKNRNGLRWTDRRGDGESERVKHHFQNHDLVTERPWQLIDVTDDVLEVVATSEVRNGMALVYSPHTTCAVMINERESGFFDDFSEFFGELIPAARYYRHDDADIRT